MDEMVTPEATRMTRAGEASFERTGLRLDLLQIQSTDAKKSGSFMNRNSQCFQFGCIWFLHLSRLADRSVHDVDDSTASIWSTERESRGFHE